MQDCLFFRVANLTTKRAKNKFLHHQPPYSTFFSMETLVSHSGFNFDFFTNSLEMQSCLAFKLAWDYSRFKRSDHCCLSIFYTPLALKPSKASKMHPEKVCSSLKTHILLHKHSITTGCPILELKRPILEARTVIPHPFSEIKLVTLLPGSSCHPNYVGIILFSRSK